MQRCCAFDNAAKRGDAYKMDRAQTFLITRDAVAAVLFGSAGASDPARPPGPRCRPGDVAEETPGPGDPREGRALLGELWTLPS